MENKGLLV
ncbi:Protein of unknown function [Bacillus mycoides]|nr:Protein of unknown function [Bacillus mycoides]SCM89178.1 Protein of unknown function [Bacillus mycoides]